MKRTRIVAGCAFALSLSLAAPALHGQEQGSPAAEAGARPFVEWARGNAVQVDSLALGSALEDLGAFGEMVGDARIVAVSEAVHAGAEPLEMRNLLFRYLVEEKSFTAIIIESGIVEGRVIDEYVSGGEGEIETVLTNGITTGFHEYDANRELVRWMRQHNADPSNERDLRFFGFDISGTPLNRFGQRGVDTPLREALAYLASVDQGQADEFGQRFGPLLPYLFNDLAGAVCLREGGIWCTEVPEEDRPALREQLQYYQLDGEQRDRFTAGIADLIAHIDRNVLAYRAASSPEDYRWGLRAAVAARQTDAFLRAQYPVGWEPTGFPPPGGAQEGRSRHMVDNFEWILGQLGADAKVVLFASRFHINGAPLTIGGGEPEWTDGAEIREMHGDEMVAVLNTAEGGDTACNLQTVLPVPDPAPETVDGMMASLGVRYFYLDMRRAPPEIAEWLDEPRVLQAGGTQTTVLPDAFDILFHTGPITPACPIHPDAVRIPLPEDVGG